MRGVNTSNRGAVGESLEAQQELLRGVTEALDARGRIGFRRVNIHVDARRITLSGRVRSFYLKQLAQHVAASVEGVWAVDNCLVVESRV